MPSDTAAVLQVSHLTRTVTSDGDERAIVRDVSFAFDRGGTYAIIGPSGAGKSSLLRLLNRLDEPTSGEVFFLGRPVSEFAPCHLRRRIGYLFQTPHMFDGTVRVNIAFAAADLPPDRLTALARQAQVPEHLIDAEVARLSVGEKQRVALARMLATKPDIVLLDEPTSALDPSNTEAIERLILSTAANDGTTVVMVSHDPAQALRMGGTALLMAGGELLEAGPVDRVVNHPTTEVGKRYQKRQLS